jgi:hypothetical protein
MAKITKKTIADVFDLITECYPGKFRANPRTSDSPGTAAIWLKMLRDFESEPVLAAVYHLCSTRQDWPPDIATVRDKAASLANGELSPPTGAEAWERIRQKIGGMEVELTPLEKKALAQVSTIYDLRRSENPTADRARYCKAFDALVAKQQLERVTLPEVKQFADHGAPALPEPKPVTQLPPQDTTDDDDYEHYVPEGEVKNMLISLADKMTIKEQE